MMTLMSGCSPGVKAESIYSEVSATRGSTLGPTVRKGCFIVDFVELPLAGAYLVRLDLRADERGFFARSFCVDEFAAAGLPADFPQQSLARSRRAGTLRGLHLQLEPHAEDK